MKALIYGVTHGFLLALPGDLISTRCQTVYTKMSKQIRTVTGQLDEDLLRTLFNPLDVQRILQIPLNNHGFMISSSGILPNMVSTLHSVRSAYHIQWRVISSFTRQASSLYQEDQ
jgi:hypothetical protein